MLKLFWKILKDERGALLDWGLDWMAARKRGKPPSVEEMQWANAPELQQKYSQNILGRIGKPRQYQYNPQFELEQPEVEAATEGTILGKLRKPTDYVGARKDITERAYGARKARLQERFADEQTQLKNMYNRLGLVSSTPGLKAQTDLASRQGLELEDISAQLSYEDIEREMEAQKLADISSQAWTGQGQVLGARQRGYRQGAQERSMQDLIRQLQEEEMYGQQAAGYLGRGAATPSQRYGSAYERWQQPNTYDWLAGGAREVEDIIRMLAMAKGG